MKVRCNKWIKKLVVQVFKEKSWTDTYCGVESLEQAFEECRWMHSNHELPYRVIERWERVVQCVRKRGKK